MGNGVRLNNTKLNGVRRKVGEGGIKSWGGGMPGQVGRLTVNNNKARLCGNNKAMSNQSCPVGQINVCRNNVIWGCNGQVKVTCTSPNK